MFRLSRPAPAEIARQIEIANQVSVVSRILARASGLSAQLPRHFAHDHRRSCIGTGAVVFAAAKQAFAQWKMFDVGWARVANPEAEIAVGQIVTVEARSLGLWTLNLSRIVEVIDLPDLYGFIYATTELHVECGEERFLLEFDAASGDVWYDLEAVSRPRSWLALAGLPVTRGFQHRFARESHRRIRKLVSPTSAME